MPKIKITYHKFGTPTNDFQIEDVYHGILQKYQDGDEYISLYFSTENIITRFRLGVVSGDIKPEDISIWFKDQKIDMNRFGAIHPWPTGFCDQIIKMSEQVLRKALDMRKKEQESKHA